MTAIYLTITWGAVLPTLALICLALDVATGTTPWQTARALREGNKQ